MWPEMTNLTFYSDANDNHAELRCNGELLHTVGRCSGMEEMLVAFNNFMRDNNLPYRLSADYRGMADMTNEQRTIDSDWKP